MNDSPKFDAAVKVTLKWEGGSKYTIDPDDPGGATKYGISKKAYPNLDIKNLTEAEALAIYKSKYWIPYYDLAPMPIAFKVFDMGVLFGVGTAVKKLQEAIVVTGGKTIKPDGAYGPITAAAVAAAVLDGKGKAIYEDFQNRMKYKVYWIILKRPTSYKYRKGWLNRIYDNPFNEWST